MTENKRRNSPNILYAAKIRLPVTVEAEDYKIVHIPNIDISPQRKI